MAVNAAAMGPSPVPARRALARPRAGHPHLGGGRDAAADDPQVAQLVLLGRVVEALVDQRQQILVEDLALAVGQGGELPIDLRELQLAQVVAQLAVASLERVAARVLAEHERRARDPDHLGPDDLVGQPVLQHAVLMDAGLVGEGVPADDRLVGLREAAGEVGKQLAGAVDLAGLHVAAEAQGRAAHVAGHDQLLHRRVPGALADAVHGAFHLARAGRDRGQGVGHRQSQIVVAVRAQHDAVRARHPGQHVAEHLGRTRPAWRSRPCRAGSPCVAPS